MDQGHDTSKYYIVRGDRSGVFFGHIANREGREVTIKGARRLWRWAGAASLSQLALEGPSRPGECRFTVIVSEITVLDAIEILPCTSAAVGSISGVPEWRV